MTGGAWGGWQAYANSTKFKRIGQILSGSVMMAEGGSIQSFVFASDPDAIRGFYASTALRPYETNNLPGVSYMAPFYHSRKSNFLFNDGHVTTYAAGTQFDYNYRPK